MYVPCYLPNFHEPPTNEGSEVSSDEQREALRIMPTAPDQSQFQGPERCGHTEDASVPRRV
jgi:hypothetical protein